MSNQKLLMVGVYVTAAYTHSVGEDLAERLRKSGWQITMTSHSIRRSVRLIDMMFTAWSSRGEYALAQVDVYSGNAFMWAEAVCWLLRRLKKPYVLTLHGGNLPLFASRWPGRVRRLLKSAKVVTTPSRYLFDEMSPYRNGMLLVPNPVSLESYDVRARDWLSPKLVWIRAFSKTYNPQMAARVVDLLRKVYPDISLIMVGPDKDGSLADTKILASRIGVEGHIEFPGGVAHDEVAEWLQKGNIFINTSNIDNTPVSVLEAMACGLAVVSTNVGGLSYLLSDEYDALLVPPDDAPAMAAAVLRLMAHPEMAKTLSQRGRQKVERMSWDAVLPHWEYILRSLV